MKTLKMIQAVFVIAVLSIIVGCSDQITSSGETGLSEKDKGVRVATVEESLPIVQTYKIQIRVKPHRTFKFDVESTGFDRFYSIDIENLSLNPNEDKSAFDCQDILVYSNKLSKGSLSCHSSGFDLSELTVENTGSSFLDLEVTLRAFKQKKPFNNIINTD